MGGRGGCLIYRKETLAQTLLPFNTSDKQLYAGESESLNVYNHHAKTLLPLVTVAMLVFQCSTYAVYSDYGGTFTTHNSW